MGQKIEALADQNGGLHLAVLDDGKCWWLSANAGFPGTMRHVMGGLLDVLDQKYAPNQLRTQHAYEALIADGGAEVIATLEDGQFRHIDEWVMSPAERRWLGEV